MNTIFSDISSTKNDLYTLSQDMIQLKQKILTSMKKKNNIPVQKIENEYSTLAEKKIKLIELIKQLKYKQIQKISSNSSTPRFSKILSTIK